jgi:hypothetical protein
MTTEQERGDVEVAERARRWLDGVDARNPEALAASVNGGLARQLWNASTDARRFGMPVLEAASVRLSNGARCRWCIAAMNSSVDRVGPPRATRAMMTLLGQPCSRCMGRMSAALQRQVDVGRSVRRAGLVASARANLHGAGEPCVICTEWQSAGRAALTAGATREAVDGLPELRPHRPRPAPTGWVKTRAAVVYLHDLEGALNCNCARCKGERVSRRTDFGGYLPGGAAPRRTT